MLLMATMTALRSAEDMADMRRRIDDYLDMIGDAFEYPVIRCAAMVDTLDWIEGRTAAAPASGDVVAPTVDEIEREAERAAEASRHLTARSEKGTYPGVVSETCYWSLRRTEIVL